MSETEAARDQDIHGIRLALERIAAAFEKAVMPEPTEGPDCPHPEESRVHFGGMGEVDGYSCKACGVFVAPDKVISIDG